MQNKDLKTKTVPIENVSAFWLHGDGWDITFGEDSEGNPYVSIAMAKDGTHKLVETNPSWKGKILKIILS